MADTICKHAFVGLPDVTSIMEMDGTLLSHVADVVADALCEQTLCIFPVD